MTGERRYGHNIPITTAERSEHAVRVQAKEGDESCDRLGPVSLDSTDQDEREHRRGSEGQVTHRKQLGLCPTDTGQSTVRSGAGGVSWGRAAGCERKAAWLWPEGSGSHIPEGSGSHRRQCLLLLISLVNSGGEWSARIHSREIL